jgi:hypothetical protein
MKTERSMNNFESRKQIIETIREKQELKRKEILNSFQIKKLRN